MKGVEGSMSNRRDFSIPPRRLTIHVLLRRLSFGRDAIKATESGHRRRRVSTLGGSCIVLKIVIALGLDTVPCSTTWKSDSSSTLGSGWGSSWR